jgi:integrase
MASAFYDAVKRRWLARFYGPNQSGTERRTVRIPAEHLRPGAEKTSADAYAQECERLAKLCEGTPNPAIITRAAAMGALTEAQALALRQRKPLPTARPSPSRALTIVAAAESHPSSARETPGELKRHRGEVLRFSAWSGAETVSELSLELVQRWVKELDGQGLAWDSRRHALLWLRRASRMAGAVGLADPLSEFVLDRRGRRPAIDVWSLDELCTAARALRQRPDLRPLACLLLGGFVGLRPSEIARVRIGDLSPDGVLAIGQREGEGKNRASRRKLPLPADILRDLRRLAGDRPADQPLIAKATRWANCGGDPFFCIDTLGQWFRDAVMRSAPGAPAVLRQLPPKSLRKSFATWATRRKLDRDHIERYLGHDNPWTPRITEHHYLADHEAEELRPFAAEISKALSTRICLHKNKSETG